MVLKDNGKLICIVGPTASGKSSLALDICKSLNRPLISCDSMQIYKGMDIGTAKPSKSEQAEVKHYMIDVCDPRTDYSVSDYAMQANAIYEDILKTGKNCVICGGTGLYLDAFLGNVNYSDESSNDSIRKEIYDEIEAKGIDYVYDELIKIDPECEKTIHKNNTKRVVRALEIFRVTGMTKTEYDSVHKTEPKYECKIIGLNYQDRDILRQRIYKRVDIMIDSGLIEEVESLMKSGMLTEGTTAAQAIGYKETLSYLKGEISKDEMITLIKNSSAQYAKRQITWFKRNKDINWIYPDTLKDGQLEETVNNILNS